MPSGSSAVSAAPISLPSSIVPVVSTVTWVIDRHAPALGAHRRACTPSTAALTCSRSWQVSTTNASAAAGEQPAAALGVGVAQPGEGLVAQRRQLGAGADRAEHEPRPVRGRHLVGDLAGQPRALLGQLADPLRRCRTRRGWAGSPRTCWSPPRPRRPRSRRGGCRATTSGRVSLRISLQPSSPAKSSSDQVGGLQHGAHRPVGDHDPLVRGRRAKRGVERARLSASSATVSPGTTDQVSRRGPSVPPADAGRRLDR